jgi:tetratricopeptide (TPR) repeat protein
MAAKTWGSMRVALAAGFWIAGFWALTGASALAQTGAQPARDCSRAQSAFDRGDTAGAAREAETCIRRSDALQGYAVRARLRFESSDFNGAESDAATLVSRAPQVGAYWAQLGGVQFRKGKLGEAQASYDRALGLDPRNPAYLLGRGKARFEVFTGDNTTNALADFDAAASLDPALIEARNMRGQALALLGRCSEAMRDLDEAVRLNPNDPYTLLYRGDCFSRLENFPAALADYDRALELKPNQASGYDARATARRLSGDPQGALADADAALMLNPGRTRAMNERGAALLVLGRMEESREAFSFVLSREPNNRFALRFRGSLNYNNQNFEGALADYRAYNQIVPGDAQVLAYEGDAARQLGLNQEAADAYRRALQIDPNQPVALQGMRTLGLEA